MKLETITIPQHVNANGLMDLIPLLASVSDSENVNVDFSLLRRITPAGLVAITAWINYRKSKNYFTDVSSISDCPIITYLQRMDLLTCCGIETDDEGFTRRSEKGRFIPLCPIPVDTESLGVKIADIIAPGGDEYGHPNAGLWDAAWYLITELANNVRQHSQRGGYISAQSTIKDGLVRIALADSGIGIKQSLADGGHRWANTGTDSQCIIKALGAKISSKGQPANEGVGLTLSSRITSLMGGRILIASGGGIVTTNSNGEPSVVHCSTEERLPGTLVTLVFKKSSAQNFDHYLMKAKELELLLHNSPNSANFTP